MNILLFLFVTAKKKITLARKLFFCYLNVEIERKKEEKFDSLLTLTLINLEFHTRLARFW